MEIHKDVIGFDSSHPPVLEKISECNVVVSFLPGDAFVNYLDLLLEAGKPVVTGSTGFEWPKDFEQKLEERSLTWIRAHNFSLGMNVVREMIKKMAYLDDLFDDGSFSMHEIHHTHKKDAPSGTALTWKEWLGKEVKITSERTGDIVGVHQLQFDCRDEKIKLSHEAKDRSIFARGAVWAAKMVVQGEDLEAGLLDFNQLVKDKLDL